MISIVSVLLGHYFGVAPVAPVFYGSHPLLYFHDHHDHHYHHDPYTWADDTTTIIYILSKIVKSIEDTGATK
jgi:hypothetical protein